MGISPMVNPVEALEELSEAENEKTELLCQGSIPGGLGGSVGFL